MKGKKRFIALLLSFLMVLSQMSVATFALDTVADENSDQTVEEQAVEETQPEADVKTVAAEEEPAATEPAAEETATEPEAVEPAAEEPAKAEPAKAEEKKAEPAKAAAKKAEPEKAEEEKAEAFDQSKTVDGVRVNVSAAKGVFPAGSKLSVSRAAVPGAVDTSDAEAAYAFDISILANGEKIQPDGKATVSFTTAEVADYDTAVYHMHDGVQKMSVSESGKTASVKTSGFSVYTVVFERTDYPDAQVKTATLELHTDETKELGEILEKFGFKIYEEGGSYEITGGAVTEGEDVLEYTEDTEDPKSSTVKLLKDGEAKLEISVRKKDGTANVTMKYDVTSTLSKYEVSFDPAGGVGPEGAYDTQEVEPEGKATKPEDPVRENSIFKWWAEKDTTTEFDFDTAIENDTDLVAQYHQHEWEYTPTGNVEGNIHCATDDGYECPYSDGFDVILDVKDVYHKGKVEVKLVDPSSEEGFPDEYFTVGGIEFYKGTVTEDFDDKDTVPYDTVKNTEGTYTARVKIAPNSNAIPEYNLFQSFQVVSAGPVAAQGLVYKDGKVVVTDDGLRPKDTTAIVLYKHPATGKYVSREELLNDGSIPIGETVIDYIVLPNDDYDPDNPEKFQIGYGEVTIDIAARTFLITYDLNGGKLGSDTGKIVWEVEEGTVITLPSPTRSGYKFDYWEGSRYNAGDKYTVTGDHTFKAVWKTAGSGKKGKGAKTGDTNDIAGLLALMFASAGALGAIGYRRRREDQ